MDYGRPNVSTSTGPAIPDEYYAIGARYADRRGRAGAMASLGAESIAGLRNSMSKPVEVLYPETSKLSGGLLASLIRSPDLDPNYVQRFQHIAIIAQLADAILSVAQATGKCIVPLDNDSNEYTSSEDCLCNTCSKETQKDIKTLGSPATMSKNGEENEAGKESAHLVNGESTAGRQEPDELVDAN
ncbi:hypothetical protein L211DRAFT_847185 [Terfezia boudieri ATCC MYA-4762]|uniref:Uncharacterized protein n=1 Tax=Terfezia boudieri ATCC MYA-4762 TaxID=1051890 RepID=A0A3N4LUL6_9PEZI|nr:hypothetical protein L211DRAFT_847185 [Terfezia boudieri ATCC MYA-4762]